jgi:hypothetical protein
VGQVTVQAAGVACRVGHLVQGRGQEAVRGLETAPGRQVNPVGRRAVEGAVGLVVADLYSTRRRRFSRVRICAWC